MSWVLNSGHAGDSIQVVDYPGIVIGARITVCFWAKWTASQSSVPIAKWGADQCWLFEMTTANKPQFYCRVAETNQSAAVANTYHGTGWNHFAGVFDGVNVRIKVNGGLTEDVTGSATAGPIDTPAQNLRVGGFDSGGSEYGGWIGEICIFDRALSNAEIRHVMRNGAEGVRGLQLYLKLDTPPTTAVRNFARNGASNNGTKFGTPTISWGTANLPSEPPMYAPSKFRFKSRWIEGKSGPIAPITGTSALTAAPAVITASGAIVNAYTGSSALTAAAATLSASGPITSVNRSKFLLLGIS